ncbi:ESX secretion-associated protein EspG [Nocardia sp. CA-128927]|uniref:ESX secretion-associated protein EspG n=1 Tax=Nocardia sp. CA-128927 TaxID=3239975 RepID=UPI003D97506B
MNRTWEFTDVEFAAAWEAIKEEYLPKPFVYTGSTELYDEHRQEKIDAWQRIRARWGHELEDVLASVVRPDIRVIIRGIDGRDAKNPKGSIRMLATRKGDNAYLIVQQPGETIWHAAGFTLIEHEVLSLADTVSAALPKVDAGKQADFEFAGQNNGAGMDYSYGRSKVQDLGDEQAKRTESFNRAPATTVGTIEVEQAQSRFGPRGISRFHLAWRDLVDDGRYVIVPGHPSTVVAADTRRLTGLINNQIAEVVRAIKDERV